MFETKIASVMTGPWSSKEMIQSTDASPESGFSCCLQVVRQFELTAKSFSKSGIYILGKKVLCRLGVRFFLRLNLSDFFLVLLYFGLEKIQSLYA